MCFCSICVKWTRWRLDTLMWCGIRGMIWRFWWAVGWWRMHLLWSWLLIERWGSRIENFQSLITRLRAIKIKTSLRNQRPFSWDLAVQSICFHFFLGDVLGEFIILTELQIIKDLLLINFLSFVINSDICHVRLPEYVQVQCPIWRWIIDLVMANSVCRKLLLLCRLTGIRWM